jgi:hypothetical protein
MATVTCGWVPDDRRRGNHYHPAEVVRWLTIGLLIRIPSIVTLYHYAIMNIAVLAHINRNVHRMAHRNLMAATQQCRSGQQWNQQIVHGIFSVVDQGSALLWPQVIGGELNES